MNSDRVLRWATLVANLGAVVGLILLVVSLEQNQAMMRAQTRNDVSVGIVDLFARVAENPQLASLRRRADAGEQLTPDYAQSSPALVEFWCAERSQFSPEFVSEFDRLIPRGTC